MSQPAELTQSQAYIEQVKQGIRYAAALESLPRTPDMVDVTEVLEIIAIKLKDTERHIGKPMYKDNKSNVPRTVFNFNQDIMGELIELYVHDPYKTPDSPRYSLMLKNVAQPLLDRLSLFSHSAAIKAVDVLVNSLIEYANTCNVESTPETIAVTCKIMNAT